MAFDNHRFPKAFAELRLRLRGLRASGFLAVTRKNWCRADVLGSSFAQGLTGIPPFSPSKNKESLKDIVSESPCCSEVRIRTGHSFAVLASLQPCVIIQVYDGQLHTQIGAVPTMEFVRRKFPAEAMNP